MSIYLCNECKNHFSEPQRIRERTGVVAPDGYAEEWEWDVCPSCGSDDIESREWCELCGARLAKGTSDYCNECLTIIETGIRAFLRRYQLECQADYKTIMKAFEEVIETRFY